MKQLWGVLLFAMIGWLAFFGQDNSYVQCVRLKIGPITCPIVPTNILFFPALYWAIVFIYVFASSPKGTDAGAILKNSVVQMFKNAVIPHPSQSLAATVMLIVFLLWYWCRM